MLKQEYLCCVEVYYTTLLEMLRNEIKFKIQTGIEIVWNYGNLIYLEKASLLQLIQMRSAISTFLLHFKRHFQDKQHFDRTFIQFLHNAVGSVHLIWSKVLD